MATVKLDPAKGVQIPNMTTTERNAVSSPEIGALIWNTTTSAVNQYNGSAWGTVGISEDTTKLPLAGGALTGAVTTNSTFDGVDIATRDAILTSTTTTAGAALPKAGGAMTGNITSAGNFALDVEADLTLTALSDIFYQTTSTNSTAGHHIFKSYNTEIMRIHGGSNRVGINKTVPDARLEIVSASETGIKVLATVSGEYGAIFQSASTNTTPIVSFRKSGGTEVMRVQSDGDVSIGTTSNEARLHVHHSSNSVALMVNSAMSSSYTDNVMKIQSSQDSNNSSYKHLEVRNGGGAVLRILDGGNVINSSNSYGQISDERIKQDIADASSQWDDIKALKVRKFKLKREVNKDVATAAYQIGVVAQELESAGMSKLVTEEAPDKEDVVLHSDFGTIDGEGVFTAGEKVKAVKYSVLYMKAIKALQEAQTRIETLETKVTALENA